MRRAWLLWERTFGSFLLISSRIHSICLFPLLMLLLSFVINYSHEYDHMLSPGSPPNESPNSGVVLGTLDIVPYLEPGKTYKNKQKTMGGAGGGK